MQSAPGHRFIPAGVRCSVYVDSPLPTGFDQTISKPYVVARTTELMGVEKHHHVLAIGTGSGYEAVVLASLSDHVFSLEFVPEPANRGGQVYDHVIHEGGWHAWLPINLSKPALTRP